MKTKSTTGWTKGFDEKFFEMYMRTDSGAHTVDRQVKSFIKTIEKQAYARGYYAGFSYRPPESLHKSPVNGGRKK